MLTILKGLCECSGVSGSEDEVRDFIINRARPYADDITTDVMGNVIIFKKGAVTSEKKLMLCAHMDEVGLMIMGAVEGGYLKFAPVGGIDKRVIIGKTVKVGAKREFGIIGSKAVHLVKIEEREKVVKFEDMYIDVGAKDKQEAERIASPGDIAVFGGEYTEFGDSLIKAKALDDRLGCAVMLKLMESQPPVDCYYAFTVQEEVGVRGAVTAAYQVEPDVALILEATTAADLPSVKGIEKVCETGGGAVVPFMDGGTIYDRGLYKIMTGLAEENNIPWQTKTVISGGTDAAAVQRSRSGVRVIAIAAPVRNLHSPSCVGSARDFEAVYNLARAFTEKFSEGGI